MRVLMLSYVRATHLRHSRCFSKRILVLSLSKMAKPVALTALVSAE